MKDQRSGSRQSGGPKPPPPSGNAKRPGGAKPTGRAASKLAGKRERDDTSKHAEEVRQVAKGRDIVDGNSSVEKRPPAFDRKEMLVVRSWLARRPLEIAPAASALVRFPRLWTTKRGRYAKFRAPGAGVYGLMRARPTF